MSSLSRPDFSMTEGLAVAEPDKKNLDDPASFTHRFATVNGIRMHYVEEGLGPLVILLHGYPFLWYLWRHQIKALAAAGYRVVAPDQRGYGQTDCPNGVDAYDMPHCVGDIVGLMKALDSRSAVLVGHDAGSIAAYYTALMRPDLVRGLLMTAALGVSFGAIRPSVAMKEVYKGLTYYRLYFATPEANTEIMRDPRRFLLGVFYSTSGSCPADKQFRWAWKSPDTFWSGITVPEKLPPHLSQQALDYYVGEFTRTGIQPALNWYAASDKSWENTSFLDGAVVQQPALFVKGDSDPTSKPMFGIGRPDKDPESLKTNYRDMREVITMPGVGHTPPEERPEEINAIVLKFLKEFGF